MEYLTAFRAVCQAGLFVVPYTNEAGMCVDVLNRDFLPAVLNMPDQAALLAHLFYHANYNSIDLCLWPDDHRASYTYGLVNEQVGKRFMCADCAELRRVYLENKHKPVSADYAACFARIRNEQIFVVAVQSVNGRQLHFLDLTGKPLTIAHDLLQEIEKYNGYLFFHARYNCADLCLWPDEHTHTTPDTPDGAVVCFECAKLRAAYTVKKA